jgi:hypothetical protein
MFLFVFIFSICVFLYYSHNVRKKNAFLYASRFGGLFFASVFFFVLFQYRLLWSHRLDFLRPDKFLWDTSKFIPVGDMTVDNLVLCLAAASALSGFTLASLPPVESFLARKTRSEISFCFWSSVSFCAASAVFGAAFYFFFIKGEIPYNYEELFFGFLKQSAIFIAVLFFAATLGKKALKWAVSNRKTLAATFSVIAGLGYLVVYFIALYKPEFSSALVKLSGSSTMTVNYIAALSSGPLFYAVLSSKGSAQRLIIMIFALFAGLFLLIKTPNPGSETLSLGSLISNFIYAKADFGMIYMYVVPSLIIASLARCYAVYRDAGEALDARSSNTGLALALLLTAVPIILTLCIWFQTFSALSLEAYPIRNPIAYGFLLSIATVCLFCAAILLYALSRISSSELHPEKQCDLRNSKIILTVIFCVIFAAVLIPTIDRAKTKIMTTSSAQRFTILFEPSLSALSNFKKFYDNILPWKESASAEIVDAYYKLYGGSSEEGVRPDQKPKEEAKYKELKKNAIFGGEGYFRSDFYD